jgi:hypothetical protein
MTLVNRTALLGCSVALATSLSLGCGGGGGGGGGGSASTITGNVSSAATDSLAELKRNWLVRFAEDFLGIARRAFAQATDTSLGDIDVNASSVNGARASDKTDAAGNFTLGGAPTGDVTVIFSRGRCEGEVVLPDVTQNGLIALDDVAFDCGGARPSKVSETFQGVIRNVPSSANGNLNVCVASGGGSRTRVVKIKSAVFRNEAGGVASFDDLADGQQIEASGEREGLGSSSALDANLVRILGTGGDTCAGQATPTPEATETPGVTPTPEETPAG